MTAKRSLPEISISTNSKYLAESLKPEMSSFKKISSEGIDLFKLVQEI